MFIDNERSVLVNNNVRYYNYPLCLWDGFPFPDKFIITCTDKEQEKYPEMIAEMFPHFESNVIPDFGKDKLWFL